MTLLEVVTVSGALVGRVDRRLPSATVDDHTPVFGGAWYSTQPRPRFGDEVWEIGGADPTVDRPSTTIDFAGMSPEWSLIAREVLYVRANQRQFRHAVVWEMRQREEAFKTGTIKHWRNTLGVYEEMARELGIGLPTTWTQRDTDKLRELVRERELGSRYGSMANTLYRLRSVLTLGGLRFDPTQDLGIAEWSGDTSTSRALATKGLDPETFRAVVGNALTYVEECSSDILAAIEWLKGWEPEPCSRQPLPKRHPIRMAHPEVVSDRYLRLHDAIQRLGGIPSATVPRRANRSDIGEPCQQTLCYAAGIPVHSGEKRLTAWLEGRIKAGVPTVPGGLPVAVSEVTRADGTTGPWRPPFCAQSIGVEAQTLQHACKIVVLAFTAMRDSEASGLPRTGWRTTWHGADALTTPLIKNGRGEPLKWWATPTVMRACEILEALADPRSENLFRSLPMLSHAAVVQRGDAYSGEDGQLREVRSGRSSIANNWQSVQDFVRRINTDSSLMGFLPIPAGWTGKGGVKDHSLPMLHPRAFRFTLASISNFVALGDVAFQRQSKHALLTMSHSYAANSGTAAWSEVLNTLANRDAADRVAKAADLYQKEWAGEQSLAGHAGRDLTRTVRSLLADLPIDDYDPDGDESQLEQFTTQVMQLPELAAAIRQTAVMLYPGTVNHCLRYAPYMECTDKAEPMQGLCRPQTCRNVLLEPEQQEVFRHRLGQVEEWLGMPRVPSAQRAVLERSKRHLQAQLRSDEGTD